MNHRGRSSRSDRTHQSGSSSPWALSSPTGWLCSAPRGSRRAADERRFDRDVLDMDVHGDTFSIASSTSSLSQEGVEEGSRTLGSVLVVDVLSAGDNVVEDVILAPNVHKLPESALVKVTLQSNNEKVTMYCSSDILKMKSPFFGTILTEQESSRPKESADARQGAPAGRASTGLWRGPIVLAEAFPYEAAALLENMHENYLLNALSWNSTFCRLSVVWALDEFIDNFSHLIDEHFEKCIHFIKSSNWRTNACLLEGMEVAVFSSDIGVEPILLTGKIVAAECRIEYSSVRCALDACDLVSSTPCKMSLTSAVFTDTEMRTCVSVSSAPGSAPGTPRTFDQQKYFSESLTVTVKEPFWVMNETTAGKWVSPDEYCLSSKKCEVPQSDKRKFWEMLKLLHELPVLNKRCKNRIKTAEQVAQLFKRKEFVALWSAEASDCLTTDALMNLVSALMGG